MDKIDYSNGVVIDGFDKYIKSAKHFHPYALIVYNNVVTQFDSSKVCNISITRTWLNPQEEKPETARGLSWLARKFNTALRLGIIGGGMIQQVSEVKVSDNKKVFFLRVLGAVEDCSSENLNKLFDDGVKNLK